MKHLPFLIILLFSLNGFGQSYMITDVFNAASQPPYKVPQGSVVNVINEGGIYIINNTGFEFYDRSRRLFKDPNFIKGISVASLKILEDMLAEQDSTMRELVGTAKDIHKLALGANEKEKGYLTDLQRGFSEQKNLLLELADKQEDLLTNELGKLERKAKRNRTFRKVLGGVCIAGAGYMVIKNGVDTLPEQVAAGVLGGAGIIAVVF